MALLRYTASADTTIVNAYEANLRTRGTGSNMGYADALEVFSIYGQESGFSSQSDGYRPRCRAPRRFGKHLFLLKTL